MRNQNFRVWDKERKEMIDYNNVFYDLATVCIDVRGDLWVDDTPYYDDTRMVVMFSTGLQNSKGVDIYEDDVVECEDIIATVTWNVVDASYYLDTGERALDIAVYKHGKIIGNIWENPDLQNNK